MEKEQVLDALGSAGIIVRVVSLEKALRDGLVVDICVDDYNELAIFCRSYQVVMLPLVREFVRLMIMEKG